MPSFRGQIGRSRQIIVSSVAGEYFPFTGQRGRIAWSGDFDLPGETVIEAGGTFRLTLDDGRSGEFAVDFMTVNSRGFSHVQVRGLSPLEVPSPVDDAVQ
jgi:hypothetical protein